MNDLGFALLFYSLGILTGGEAVYLIGITVYLYCEYKEKKKYEGD